MKVTGLKIVQVKEWKAKSTFTNDQGQSFEVAANQKIICRDGDDFVNLTLVTDVPVSLKSGDSLSVDLLGFTRTSFGVNIKGSLA